MDDKDMHPREDDRTGAGSVAGEADEARRESPEPEESPVPDPEAGDTSAEDDPEAD